MNTNEGTPLANPGFNESGRSLSESSQPSVPDLQPPAATSNASRPGDNLKEKFPPVAKLVKKVAPGAASLLPVLEETQRIYGYLPIECLDLVAEALQVEKGQAHWIATVLVPFRFEPGPEHTVRICRGEACKKNGSLLIDEALRDALARCGFADKRISYESVTCLGACSRGPNIIVDGKIHTGITAESAAKIIESF